MWNMIYMSICNTVWLGGFPWVFSCHLTHRCVLNCLLVNCVQCGLKCWASGPRDRRGLTFSLLDEFQLDICLPSPYLSVFSRIFFPPPPPLPSSSPPPLPQAPAISLGQQLIQTLLCVCTFMYIYFCIYIYSTILVNLCIWTYVTCTLCIICLKFRSVFYSTTFLYWI